MTRFPFLLGILLATSALAPLSAAAETPQQEKVSHPSITRAIDELEDAIRYMERAPHDFGGHKADALKASREAVRQLRAALQYRASVDTARGR